MKMQIKARGRELALAAAGASILAGALASCSQILSIDSDRYVAADSGEASTVVPPPADDGGPWDCLGNPNETFPANAMTTVQLVMTNSLMPILTAQTADGGSALDPVQYTPLPGEQVRACPSLYSGTCAGGTTYQTTDDAGIATFSLLNSFDGFYQFNDPTLFTTTFFPSQMMSGDKQELIPATILPLSATQELGALLNGIHLSYDTDGGLGHILLTVTDCHDHGAPGVVFTPSGIASTSSGYNTLIFYTEGTGGQGSELPSTTATATDNTGTGGLLNVPAGAFTVKALLASDGRQVGSINVLVNPGVASSGILRVRTH
jgi:hypothetical protein